MREHMIQSNGISHVTCWENQAFVQSGLFGYKRVHRIPFLSVLVNGSPIVEFKLEKWITTRISPSPFLYIIYAEGLTGVVRPAHDKNLLEYFGQGQRG